MNDLPISRAELARRLGVSRTYVTLLLQGKRTPSQLVANKLQQLMLTYDIPDGLADVLERAVVGKGGLEPPRLSTHDPKSCSSANSDTPPRSYNLLFYHSYLNKATALNQRANSAENI